MVSEIGKVNFFSGIILRVQILDISSFDNAKDIPSYSSCRVSFFIVVIMSITMMNEAKIMYFDRMLDDKKKER